MTAHDDQVSLGHMLDHAREAREMAAGRSRESLDQDRTFALAMVRLLEIVGEAATRVSVTARLDFPKIPWSRVVGLRNRLVHAYDDVDYDVLWEIVQSDLDELIEALSRKL